MKNLLTAALPAVVLLALSGCAGTAGLATSEDDGVYYNSNDRTTASAPAAGYANGSATGRYQNQNQGGSYNNGAGSANGGYNNQPTPAQTQTDEAANPDYNGSTGNAQNGGSDQYYNGGTAANNGNGNYDQGYNNGYNNGRSSARFRSPYAGPGVAYYAPPMWAPYNVIAVPSYGWGGGYCGFSPYGGYGYDPFYSGFSGPGYGYGSGFSISFGYGFGGGFGGYGYRPYGGFYDPYWGSYYGRGYGGGGYYGSGYGGYGGGYYGGGYGYGGQSRNVIYTGNSSYSGDRGAGNTVLVGPRGGRGGDVTGGRSAAGAANQGNGGRVGRWDDGSTGGGIGTPGGTGGRGNVIGGGVSGNATTLQNVRTTRILEDGGTKPGYNAPMPVSGNGGGRYGENQGGGFQNNAAPTGKEEAAYGGGRTGRMAPVNAPEPTIKNNGYGIEDGRGGQGNGRFENGSGGYNQAQPVQPQGDNMQPVRRGGFFGGNSQPQQQSQPQRNYERPQRSYEAPQRSYEAPQRSYERPAYNGGGGGGGNSGGGGGNSGGGRSGRW